MLTYRPFLMITLAFILGIILDAWLHPSFAILGFVFLGTVILATMLHRWRIVAGGMFLVAVSALGALDFVNNDTLAADHVLRTARWYYGKPTEVEGVIASDIQSRALGKGVKTTFTLDVRRVNGLKKSGKVLVVLFGPVDLHYGDEISVTGKLHRPFEYSSRGRLTYRSYLAQRKIYLMLTVKKGGPLMVRNRDQGNSFLSFALRCRTILNRSFDQYLSRSEAGLMQALITGERSEVPPHVREIFFRTGTVHILAISGMNVAMVAFGLFLCLNLFPIGRRWQMTLTVMIIAFYALMTGGSAPVVRAAVISVVFLGSFMIERESDPVNSLSFAAFVILIFSPHQLFDVGFQLSFGSVLSIILFTPIILGPWGREGLLGPPWVRGALQALAVSLAVMIGIGPLLSYYFQVVTPVSLIANVPVIPLVGLATALGGGLLVFASIFPPVAALFAVCAKVTINLMVLILYGFSQIPGGNFFVPEVSLAVVLGYYAGLVLVYVGICVFIRSRGAVWEAWQVGL